MAHSFQSCSATASSAAMRSASSRSSSTRRRAATSRCSNSPTTDGIPDLHRSDDTTRHHFHRTTDLRPTSENAILKPGKRTTSKRQAHPLSVEQRVVGIGIGASALGITGFRFMTAGVCVVERVGRTVGVAVGDGGGGGLEVGGVAAGEAGGGGVVPAAGGADLAGGGVGPAALVAEVVAGTGVGGGLAPGLGVSPCHSDRDGLSPHAERCPVTCDDPACLRVGSWAGGGTFHVQGSEWARGLAMSGDGKGQIGHVGGVHLRLLAERTGLTGALSAALARRGSVPLHDRGQVLVDLAVAITLGAMCIRDIRLLEHQRPVFGPVASYPTVWRALKEIDERRPGAGSSGPGPRCAVTCGELLRDRPEGFPEVVVDGVRADRVDGHRHRRLPDPRARRRRTEPPAPTRAPSATTSSWRCATTPARSSSRDCTRATCTANDTAVNIDLLARAVAQLPWWRRAEDPGPGGRGRVLPRAAASGSPRAGGREPRPSAGSTRSAGPSPPASRPPWRSPTGWACGSRPPTPPARCARTRSSPTSPACSASLTGWPAHHTVIARKEPLHPRYVKDASAYEVRQGDALPDVRHQHPPRAGRVPGRPAPQARPRRAEDPRSEGVRDGPAALARDRVNAAWLTATALAGDLRAWLQLLALDGDLAKATPRPCATASCTSRPGSCAASADDA